MTSAFHHHGRNMTPARRAKIFLAWDGHCHKCDHKIKLGEDWDVDHILALELGGTDDDANLGPICDLCHSKKTGEDHSAGGKIKRMAAKHVVPKKYLKKQDWRKW